MVLETEMEDMKAFKRVLHAGKGQPIEIVTGTKAIFDYEARVPRDALMGYPQDPGDWEPIDDTRKPWPDGYGEPLELIFGKQFQLTIFETCLKGMLIDEIAQYDVTPAELFPYPMVSKKLRDISKGKSKHHHGHDHDAHEHHQCFAMTAQHGTGYPVLDKLMKEPKPIRFTFHLIKAAGNALFAAGSYRAAGDKYREALGRVESLLLREKPGDEEYKALDAHNVAIYLNLAQCCLNLGDYYEAISAATEALSRDNDNEKALFRRAKARIGVWDLIAAREDAHTLQERHPKSKAIAQRLLTEIDKIERDADKDAKSRYSALFSEKQKT